MGLIRNLPPPPFSRQPQQQSLLPPVTTQKINGGTTSNLQPPSFSYEDSKAARATDQTSEALSKLDASQRTLATSSDKVLVGIAFAGAGKTTTAVAYTLVRPESKVLYLCLNKQNQIEAQSRFPSWVDCKTSHSLAFATVGKNYMNRLAKGSWRLAKFAQEHGIFDVALAGAVQQTILNFICSSAPEITAKHIEPAMEKFAQDPSQFAIAHAFAQKAWKKISSLNETCEITHDVYLKIWAMGAPSLSRYSHIIVDEAQDSNATIIDVLAKQNNTRLYIGDSHQSIYQFRGAENAIEALSQQGARVIKMPKTWRFGPNIAQNASRLLHLLKEEDTAIIGAGPGSTSKKTSAFLARTNAGLIEYAVSRRGKGIHWVGGIEKYAVDILNDAWALRSDARHNIRDAYLRTFPSWNKYVEMAGLSKDAEARMLIKTVDNYRHDTPILVEELKRFAIIDAASPKVQINITTSHKAKGLEWDTVSLAEDFADLDDAFGAYLQNNLLHEDAGQEINMAYVAMSRARHELNLPPGMAYFLGEGYARNLALLTETKNLIHSSASVDAPGS